MRESARKEPQNEEALCCSLARCLVFLASPTLNRPGIDQELITTEYYIKTICTTTYIFVQQHCLVTTMISSMIHLNKTKKITEQVDLCRRFRLKWNWYTQFHRLDSHFNRFSPTFITLLAEVSYLVVCISRSFHGCLIRCLGQPWKYYENTNGKKMRTLLAGYSFIGFALLYFPPVTHVLSEVYFQLVERPNI